MAEPLTKEELDEQSPILALLPVPYITLRLLATARHATTRAEAAEARCADLEAACRAALEHLILLAQTDGRYPGREYDAAQLAARLRGLVMYRCAGTPEETTDV